MSMDAGAYVVRSVVAFPDGRASYTVVDMNGRVSSVTIPHELTLTELVDPILRAHVASSPPNTRLER